MKNRDRFTILAAILEATEDGPASRTRVMYSASLSYAQLKEYVKTIVDHDMLAEVEGARLARLELRPNGMKFLKLYREICELLGSGETTPLVEVLQSS